MYKKIIQRETCIELKASIRIYTRIPIELPSDPIYSISHSWSFFNIWRRKGMGDPWNFFVRGSRKIPIKSWCRMWFRGVMKSQVKKKQKQSRISLIKHQCRFLLIKYQCRFLLIKHQCRILLIKHHAVSWCVLSIKFTRNYLT